MQDKISVDTKIFVGDFNFKKNRTLLDPYVYKFFLYSLPFT